MSYMQSLENGKNVQAENFSEILQNARFIFTIRAQDSGYMIIY